MSAAQDVVQQLILRLIHFLLNCLQTAAVIQPVRANPGRRRARRVGDEHVEALHSSTSAMIVFRATAPRDGGAVSVWEKKGRFKSFRWESIEALELPGYHLELCVELYLPANTVLARRISLHNTEAIGDHAARLQSRCWPCTFVQNSDKKMGFPAIRIEVRIKNQGN